jgi:hypothetical protein
VELRGLEPLTPTLPGGISPIMPELQAHYQAKRCSTPRGSPVLPTHDRPSWHGSGTRSRSASSLSYEVVKSSPRCPSGPLASRPEPASPPARGCPVRLIPPVPKSLVSNTISRLAPRITSMRTVGDAVRCSRIRGQPDGPGRSPILVRSWHGEHAPYRRVTSEDALAERRAV